jgi:LysR family transcriptional regulator, glycine cleavage system transcriptional activator
MQNRLSLNAVRVFTVAAHHRSIALASADLGVTPSAVSHQIKKLELDLGIRLFARRNNAIELTEEGRRFREDATAAIAMIERSAESLRRNANEIVIRVSVSIAVRWLIPALEGFKRHFPSARVRVESVLLAKPTLGTSADMAISYERAGSATAEGELLACDFSRPVLSPSLLRSLAYAGPEDIFHVPALKCTRENWDWIMWAEKLGFSEHAVRIAHEFDTDDSALHAAVAGLGMVLASPLMTRTELAAGTLVPLPGFEPVEFGSYRLIVRSEPSRMVSSFRDWLRKELSGSDSH